MFYRLFHTVALPRLRWPHLLALALCLFAGGIGNLYRAAWRPVGEAHALRGFWPAASEIDGETARWSRGYSKAEVFAYAWRPLRWRVRMIAPPVAPKEAAADLAFNDVRVTRVSVGHAWRTIEFVANPPAGADMSLQFNSNVYGDEEIGVGVGRVTVEPVFTVWNVSASCLIGAFAGLLLWTVVLIAPVGAVGAVRPAASFDGQGWSVGRGVGVLLIIWIYLAIWAVVKPPLQAPDEPQHVLRASSVVLQPWATRTPNILTLDRRFLNPFALFPTADLGNVFYNRHGQLSYEAIARLKAVPWDLPPNTPDTYNTPLASYPAGYYAPIFALAEGSTALLHLTPYQNIYAYRAWTVIAAGLLWLLVYRALLAIPATAPHAALLLAFLLLNPMLAFVSSSATPDAVNVPLATLAILLTYRTCVTGERGWLATLALVACGLTKPSILLIYASLPLPALLLWRAGAISLDQLAAGGIAVARAVVISYCVHYAWSPPRFFGGQALELGLDAYISGFGSRLPFFWISYWGWLGWLDYALPTWWYGGFFALVVCGAIVAAMRTPLETRRFAGFAALVGLGYFVCMIIGEYWYLPMAGYNFQGRHLLPAGIAAAGLVLSDSRLTRWTITGWLAVMNLLLMHESIVRYFTGDYAMFRASWP